MAHVVRFLHTADFHLGAPMRGFRDLSDFWMQRLQTAIVQAFDHVIDTALSNQVDFVVLSGDAFDTTHASYGDYLHFFDGVRALGDAGIPLYMTTGNHDPFTTWRYDFDRLPPNAHLLGGVAPEFALFERDGEPLCLIGARGYRNKAWPIEESIAAGITRGDAIRALAAEHPAAHRAPFSVGVIHTGLNLDQSKAYCDPEVLMAADVDYWACGHLHKRYVLSGETGPRIVFPGCIQGRDLKESGERGCFLTTLERDSAHDPVGVSLEFVPTASVVFQTMQIDVSACQTLADVSRLVLGQLFHENAKASCDEMVVRIVLTGSTNLHGFLSKPDVRRDLRRRFNNAHPSFFCDTLVDRTVSPRDRLALMGEGLFEGQLLRVSSRQRAHEDEMVNYVQSELVKRGIDVPTSIAQRIGAFGEAAETLVMDLLEEDGS